MKKVIASLLFPVAFLLLLEQASAQNKEVEIFIKTWGFLKYHHPLIANGRIDWDSVFISNVRTISLSKNKSACNKQLDKLMAAAGSGDVAGQDVAGDTLFAPNYKSSTLWINSSPILDKRIRAKLQKIKNGNYLRLNKYIRVANNTADYSGENRYDNIGFPDCAHRLLFLSRFWNSINYFAPYKYLINEPWDDVLNRLIPRFISATDSVSYYKVLLELGKSLQDGHCQLSKSYQTTEINNLVFGRYTVPFYCDILEDTLIIRKTANDSLCRSAGIQKGDVILRADNIPVKQLMDVRKKYISASNKRGESHSLSWFVLDGQTPRVTLTVKRGSKIFSTAIQRTPSARKNWGDVINYTSNETGYKKLGDSVLLIYAMQIWKGNLDTLTAMIRHAKAVIFDVRNYPQNDAFYYIVDPFLSEPRVINYITEPMADGPGRFRWIQSPKIGKQNPDAFKGKVIILADERTQSQGEYSCMVLQTIPGAVTIGRQTAGADGLVTYIPMGGHLTLSYSGYGVYYPDKGQTQRSGIKINISVEKKAEAIRDGTDETMERALKYLQKGR